MMKRILITGANSYIGTSFERYVSKWPNQYRADTMDMHGDDWKQASFSGYDTVFHVAGIAHVDFEKVSSDQRNLYYDVNTDLAIHTAQKAKADGVKQFVYMSSAIVYGDSAPVGQKKIITKESVPFPSNFYGDSKLKAEKGILPLQGKDFNVVILRPPMIYGKGSKGNYPVLAKYAIKLPIFPKVDNQRSILYIDNLCELVRLAVEHCARGIFCPQNEEVVSTSDLVKEIAYVHGKHIWMIGGVTKILNLFHGVKIINKAFGSFEYSLELSEINGMEYRVVNFESSIKRTEI